MKIVRYLAVAATALMSLMNLPIAFDDGGAGIPRPLAWAVTLLGVAGLVVAVALARGVSWAAPAAVAVGALNLAGAVAALVQKSDGAVIGLVVSTTMTALAIAVVRAASTRRAQLS
jgi:hypothetical protein